MCNHSWQIISKEYVQKWKYWIVTLKCLLCGDIKQKELRGDNVEKIK